MSNENQLKVLIEKPYHNKRVSIIKTIIVKEGSIQYGSRHITTPELAAGLARDLYQNADKEMLIAVSTDSKCKPLALEIVAIGNINTCIVSPREVYKHAILSNAANLLIYHNHVSGECTPSSEDIEVTKRMVEVGELLGIPLLDHIIIGEGYSYLSLREEGVVSFRTKSQYGIKD